MASSTHHFSRTGRGTGEAQSAKEETAPPPSRRRGKAAKAEVSATERISGAAEIILVGCGPVAHQMHMPALQVLQNAGRIKVRAVVDPAEGWREWGRRNFPTALSAASIDGVVAPPDTLAIITTPARFHAAQCNAALKRGWHVLCNTPLAATAREAAQMITAAQQHERVLAVALPHRFFPAARYLRTLCHDHLLGPPISFGIHDGTTRAAPEGGPPGPEKFESPDGVLNELGVRVFDLLTWWLGSASVKHYADDAMGGVEANAFIELTFPENVRGTVHLSRDWPTTQSYTFVFERGIVRWDATSPSRLTLQIASAPSALQGELVTPLSPRHSSVNEPLLATHDQAAVAELENILAAFVRREPLRVPATEAMHSLHLIEECYARRTPLPQPWLPQNEAVQARAFSPPMALRRS
jgi:predicted dehydrogenase